MLTSDPLGLASPADPLGSALARAATPQNEVLLTTVFMDKNQYQLKLLQLWHASLNERARNALIVGANKQTCRDLKRVQLPCFLDKRQNATSKGQKINFFGPQVTLKWWYLREVIRRNYSVFFADADVLFLQDPFQNWKRDFDVQGLSDIRDVELSVGEYHELKCKRPWMEMMYQYRKEKSTYPCQSIGLMAIKSTPASTAFIDDMYSYFVNNPTVWDQRAWQLMVMRYTIGLGDDLAPLRYRLFPTSKYINVEYYFQRRGEKMDVSQMVAVHCGYINSNAEKLYYMNELASLKPELRKFLGSKNVWPGDPTKKHYYI